jgi:hypothetical protein
MVALEQYNNIRLTGRPYSRRDLFEEIERPLLTPRMTEIILKHYRILIDIQDGMKDKPVPVTSH